MIPENTLNPGYSPNDFCDTWWRESGNQFLYNQYRIWYYDNGERFPACARWISSTRSQDCERFLAP